MLTANNLRVRFGGFPAVDGVDLHVEAGELLGIVGESGSGKSVSMMGLMGLIGAPGVVEADRCEFLGHDLLRLKPRERRRLVGRDIAMVFQDALSALNPSYTIGYQIEEVLRLHLGLKGAAARDRAVALLAQVEIPDPERRLRAYPHELSGGMNQRVMIAMAIACGPKLLIADEPTTALDVTIQAQIMALLLKLQREHGMALIMITHDLAVVAEMAARQPPREALQALLPPEGAAPPRERPVGGARVAVMYAGQVVETGPVPDLFDKPQHPYTAALLAALPEHNKGQPRLQALGGIVPGAHDRPSGCLLAPRCSRVQARCHAERPALNQGVRCHFPL
jgi:dipeptide transport system ATP-binding protein